MSNQQSLDMLYADAGQWLQSRHLTIYGDAPPGAGPVCAFTFGAQAWTEPDAAAANRALQKGWRQTEGHDKGRAARTIGYAASMGANLLEGVTENMGYFAMQLAGDVNLSGVDYLTPLASFGPARFAVTGQLTGCSFIWDKTDARVGHVRPSAGISGTMLRTALGSRPYTLFGTRGENGGAGEYDIGEDVSVIGVNAGGWRFFAQVHVRGTTRVQRVIEL